MDTTLRETKTAHERHDQRTPPYSPEWCFFLDIDGTLMDFAERPDVVSADAELRTILNDLRRACGGALALISGRSVADIDRMFAPTQFPVAGQHGNERRAQDGQIAFHIPAAANLGEAIVVLEDFVARYPGLLWENKGATLALHYRLAPQHRRHVFQVMREVCYMLGEDFELQTGKMLVEIKPAGKHKGTAIAEFMEENPFRGRVPVFVGDDLTDEYGFALVNKLYGCAVKVGPGTTVAHWRLADAKAVRAWLRAYADQYTHSRGA